MNRYPHLKSFLKDFEAEEYGGIAVEFVSGKAAVLSIYSDGELKEEVDLHQYGSKDELHALMAEKGFVRMSPEEIVAMKERKAVEVAEAQKRREAERAYYREESRKRRDAKMAAMEEAKAIEEKEKAGEKPKTASGEEL